MMTKRASGRRHPGIGNLTDLDQPHRLGLGEMIIRRNGVVKVKAKVTMEVWVALTEPHQAGILFLNRWVKSILDHPDISTMLY